MKIIRKQSKRNIKGNNKIRKKRMPLKNNKQNKISRQLINKRNKIK